jgi:hypothetical protein
MLIQLTDSDLAKMPGDLCKDLLKWLQSVNSCSLAGVKEQSQDSSLTKVNAEELKQSGLEDMERHIVINQEGKGESHHILLSQLLDAGITRSGMPVRVRLTRKQAKASGRDYLNGLTISSRGTVIHGGQEFDKPSPLAAKLNGCAANGWEYIEVKKGNDWIRLDNLRQQIR